MVMELKLNEQHEDSWMPPNEKLANQKHISISALDALGLTTHPPPVNLKANIFPEVKMKISKQVFSGREVCVSSDESMDDSTLTDDSAFKDNLNVLKLAHSKSFFSRTVSSTDITAATVPTLASDEPTNVAESVSETPLLATSQSPQPPTKELKKGSIYDRLSKTHTYSSMHLRKSRKPPLKPKETKRFVTYIVSKEEMPLRVENKSPLKRYSSSSRGRAASSSVHDRLASQFTKVTYDKRKEPSAIRSSSPKPFFTLVRNNSFNSFIDDSPNVEAGKKVSTPLREQRDEQSSIRRDSLSRSRRSPSPVHCRLSQQHTKSSADKQKSVYVPSRYPSPKPFYTLVKSDSFSNAPESAMRTHTPIRDRSSASQKNTKYQQQLDDDEQTVVSKMKEKKHKMQNNVQTLLSVVQANASTVQPSHTTTFQETKNIIENEKKRIVQKNRSSALYDRLINRANEAAMKKRLLDSIPGVETTTQTFAEVSKGAMLRKFEGSTFMRF